MAQAARFRPCNAQGNYCPNEFWKVATGRSATDLGEVIMKKVFSVAAALALASVAALAHKCPNEVKAIDGKLATSPKLAAADMEKVKKLRADGEAAHKAGE